MNQLDLYPYPGSVRAVNLIQYVRNSIAKGLLPGSSPPALVLLPIFLYPLANAIRKRIKEDYKLFLSLGPGGTPSTPLGYLKVQMLKFLIANPDVLTPPKADPASDAPGPFFETVFDLPARKGARPQIAGIAPQRQISQRSDAAQIAALSRAMRAIAAANPETVKTDRSCFEKQSLGLFLTDRAPAGNPWQGGNGEQPHQVKVPTDLRTSSLLATNINFSDLHVTLAHSANAAADTGNALDEEEPINATCGLPPEVAHMHGSEGSLHLTLHPEDAAIVLRKGWGERHPLAGAGGLMRDIFNGRGMRALRSGRPSEGWLPRGFVLVYAPRNEEERKAVGKIVRAAAWWVGGVRLRECAEF